MRPRIFIFVFLTALFVLLPCLCFATPPAMRLSDVDGGVLIAPDVASTVPGSARRVQIGQGQWAIVGSVYRDGKLETWTVTVLISSQPAPPPGPGPDPPNPPPPPPPTVNAEEIAYQAAVKLKLPADQATILAKVYEEVAKQVGLAITTPDQLIAATKFARALALGTDSAPWDPWINEVGLWLEEQRKAEKLTTMPQFQTAWNQIAAGLRRVK